MKKEILNEKVKRIVAENMPLEKINGDIVIVGNSYFSGLETQLIRVLLENNKMYGTNFRIFYITKENEIIDALAEDYKINPSLIISIQDFKQTIDINCITEQTDCVKCVFYLAFHRTKDIAISKLNEFIINNSYNIIELFKLNPEYYVHESNQAIYGSPDSEKLSDFDFLPSFNHLAGNGALYVEGHRFAESLLGSLANMTDTKIIISRTSNMYGLEMDLSSKRPLEDFLISIMNNHDINIESDGTAVRDYITHTDIIRGYFYCLLYGAKEKIQAYNISTNNPISVKELAIRFRDLSGKDLKVNVLNNTSLSYRRIGFSKLILDNSRLLSTGFRPFDDLDDGLKRILDYYLE